MLIGVYVSNLSSVLLYSICLCIDTRQGCTTSWCEWTISTQKNDRKKERNTKSIVGSSHNHPFSRGENIGIKSPAYLYPSSPSLLGGIICYASCLATVGAGSLIAGSWEATWMASYGHAISAGCLFVFLPATGIPFGSVFTRCLTSIRKKHENINRLISLANMNRALN